MSSLSIRLHHTTRRVIFNCLLSEKEIGVLEFTKQYFGSALVVYSYTYSTVSDGTTFIICIIH